MVNWWFLFWYRLISTSKNSCTLVICINIDIFIFYLCFLCLILFVLWWVDVVVFLYVGFWCCFCCFLLLVGFAYGASSLESELNRFGLCFVAGLCFLGMILKLLLLLIFGCFFCFILCCFDDVGLLFLDVEIFEFLFVCFFVGASARGFGAGNFGFGVFGIVFVGIVYKYVYWVLELILVMGVFGFLLCGLEVWCKFYARTTFSESAVTSAFGLEFFTVLLFLVEVIVNLCMCCGCVLVMWFIVFFFVVMCVLYMSMLLFLYSTYIIRSRALNVNVFVGVVNDVIMFFVLIFVSVIFCVSLFMYFDLLYVNVNFFMCFGVLNLYVTRFFRMFYIVTCASYLFVSVIFLFWCVLIVYIFFWCVCIVFNNLKLLFVFYIISVLFAFFDSSRVGAYSRGA